MQVIAPYNGRRSRSAVNHATLATFLRERREQLGIGQIELAIRAGVSHVVVQRYERGGCMYTPSRTTLRKLAAALAVDPRELIGAVVPLAGVPEVQAGAALERTAQSNESLAVRQRTTPRG